MNLQLVKLPVETQEVLKLAACIGNQFDLKTLVTVSGKSSIDTATDLWRALQEGLILPISETYKFFQSNELDNIDSSGEIAVPYKFLHDRVQQAAYSLIPEEQKQTTHFQIGQLLLKETSLAERQEKLFEIVAQLNIGKGLISEQQERDTLAQLNWEAGEKAKAATAYTTALDFFSVGIDLLSVTGWERQYELSLALYSSAAEVAYLGGDFERMEQLIQIVLKHAKTLLDQIQVYQTQIQAYQSQDQLLQAIETALSVLKLLDIHFPEQPSLSDIQTALDEVSNSLSETSIENLIDLPCMIDPHKLAAIRILVSVAPSVKQSVPTLLPLIAQKMIFLSLQNGNAAESAFAYTLYGSVLCITSGNIDTGYQFAQLGLNLLQRFTTKEFHSRTYVVANFLVVHWKDHLRKTLHPLLEAYQSGLETGDLEHAAWSVTFYCSHAYFVGHSLPELESEIASYSEVIRQSKQQSVLNTFSVFEQVVLTWLGKRPVLHSLNDNNDYLEDLLQLVLKTNNRYALAAIHINQLILFYGFGDYKQASIHASVAREYLIAVAGSILFNIFHVYEALTDLAIYSNVDPKQQSQLLEKVKVNQATLKQWTDFAPENNLHRFNLVEAELHRVLGLKAEALQSYERAIAIAKANGYIQDEALSNELAAKFYLDWGKEKIAAGYMQEAYYCYTRWGAKAKIIDLEQQYPQLLAGILQAPTLPITYEGTVAPTLMRSFSNVSSSQNLWLDFPAVMKAAQAISQEMELEKLLATLIQMVITSAGAQIGRLLLCQDGQWLVVAQADSKQTQRLEILLEQCREIPQRVIYAVARTQQTTVFENLSDSAEFAGDHYIITHQPKSVLCTPISHQGKLISILYLENNLTVGAFTSDHLQIIQLLTAQAAISLENAQLYCQLEEYSHSLEQKVSERTQELTQKATQLESALQELKHTQAQLVQAEKMSSLGQLVAGIAHEINNPINFIYANIEPANEYVKSLIELNDLYQKYYPQPVPEIQEKIIDMEVDFLVDDLQNLLESMKIGAKRIQKIVLSLRNFSRLDEAEIKAVDLHEGMDSTLLILQHRLKNSSKNTEIGIIKSYSKIPLVNCYPSALNQVFMNILSNAIDALHQVEINHEPTITIRTEVQEEKYVVIRIIDNGIGMTESVQNKIFEPFFTTKPVGSGTGLGLSISYSIIAEQHGGQLSCISTPGKGTEFVIQIPL